MAVARFPFQLRAILHYNHSASIEPAQSSLRRQRSGVTHKNRGSKLGTDCIRISWGEPLRLLSLKHDWVDASKTLIPSGTTKAVGIV